MAVDSPKNSPAYASVSTPQQERFELGDDERPFRSPRKFRTKLIAVAVGLVAIAGVVTLSVALTSKGTKSESSDITLSDATAGRFDSVWMCKDTNSDSWSADFCGKTTANQETACAESAKCCSGSEGSSCSEVDYDRCNVAEAPKTCDSGFKFYCQKPGVSEVLPVLAAKYCDPAAYPLTCNGGAKRVKYCCPASAVVCTEANYVDASKCTDSGVEAPLDCDAGKSTTDGGSAPTSESAAVPSSSNDSSANVGTSSSSSLNATESDTDKIVEFMPTDETASNETSIDADAGNSTEPTKAEESYPDSDEDADESDLPCDETTSDPESDLPAEPAADETSIVPTEAATSPAETEPVPTEKATSAPTEAQTNPPPAPTTAPTEAKTNPPPAPTPAPTEAKTNPPPAPTSAPTEAKTNPPPAPTPAPTQAKTNPPPAPTAAPTPAKTNAPPPATFQRQRGLTVINKCAGMDVFFGGASKRLQDSCREGRFCLDFETTNPAFWVAPIGKGSLNNGARTLAELTYDQSNGVWYDISRVKGYNEGLKIEYTDGNGKASHTVSCVTPDCKDAYWLCDTAVDNKFHPVYNGKLGGSAVITFCPEGGNSEPLSPPRAPYKNPERAVTGPGPVYCACPESFSVPLKELFPAPGVQLNGNMCGPIN